MLICKACMCDVCMCVCVSVCVFACQCCCFFFFLLIYRLYKNIDSFLMFCSCFFYFTSFYISFQVRLSYQLKSFEYISLSQLTYFSFFFLMLFNVVEQTNIFIIFKFIYKIYILTIYQKHKYSLLETITNNVLTACSLWPPAI